LSDQLRQLMDSPLHDLDLAAIAIDGIEFQGHLLVVAMYINEQSETFIEVQAANLRVFLLLLPCFRHGRELELVKFLEGRLAGLCNRSKSFWRLAL